MRDGLGYLQTSLPCALCSGFLPADASTVDGSGGADVMCSSLKSNRAIDGRWLGRIRCADEIERKKLIWCALHKR